jgi:hypothetical protein
MTTLGDFSKDVRRLLLANWTEDEIRSHLSDPDYFFEHVVIPRMSYLRRQGQDVPKVRVSRTPAGVFRVVLND